MRFISSSVCNMQYIDRIKSIPLWYWDKRTRNKFVIKGLFKVNYRFKYLILTAFAIEIIYFIIKITIPLAGNSNVALKVISIWISKSISNNLTADNYVYFGFTSTEINLQNLARKNYLTEDNVFFIYQLGLFQTTFWPI